MTPEENKGVVRRFNAEVVSQGNRHTFDEIVDPDFVDNTAMPGGANDRESLWDVFDKMLRPAIPDLEATIHDLIAEGDRVATRKTFSGTMRGPLLGVAATGQPISIEVNDIFRLRNGRYVEHWGQNSLAAVLMSLERG